MKNAKSFRIAFISLVLGLMATISLAQQAPDESSPPQVGAGANLVVTSVSGPATAFLNQTISLTYTVKNQGTAASIAYEVDLYLSTDQTIDPATDRLLGTVKFSTGLAPGKSKKTTTKVLVPINGLSGSYYYGALVGSSQKASSKKVSLIRYSLGDNNETVTDHKTGLIWQRADDNVTRTWADANQYCIGLALGGKDDWRLPSIHELETITDYSRYNPAIDPGFECVTWFYWSSSNRAGFPGNAWNVMFYDGGVGWSGKQNKLYVRCVRGEPW